MSSPLVMVKAAGQDTVIFSSLYSVVDMGVEKGRTVKAPTLGGPVDLAIPTGAQSGKTLRLKGRGLPGSSPGNQYVELLITVPNQVTEKVRSLYDQLEREHPGNPRDALGL